MVDYDGSEHLTSVDAGRYANGEMTDAEVAAVKDHINDCGPCRLLVAEAEEDLEDEEDSRTW